MAILLVRHAKAGDRDRWEGPDDARPLTAPGRAQAAALVSRFDRYAIERVLSSPYLRCTQTVEPLATARGLAVEPCDELAEGAGPAAVALVHALATGPDIVLCTHGDVVLCTHGDVVYEVLDALAAAGVVLPADGGMKKGSTWIINAKGGAFASARYLPPPG